MSKTKTGQDGMNICRKQQHFALFVYSCTACLPEFARWNAASLPTEEWNYLVLI